MKKATNGKSEQVVIVTRWDARLPARFWDMVSEPTATGCWLWMGCQRRGYGGYRVGGKGSAFRGAHRVAYETLVGDVSSGLQLDHICRNRDCVNPAHLEPVTARENTLRGQTPAARNAAKTHCPKGHAYDAENTHLDETTGRHIRVCRACGRENMRRFRAKQREATI